MILMFPPKVVGSRIFHRPIHTNAKSRRNHTTAKSSPSLLFNAKWQYCSNVCEPLSSRCTPKRIAVSRNIMNRNPSPVIAWCWFDHLGFSSTWSVSKAAAISCYKDKHPCCLFRRNGCIFTSATSHHQTCFNMQEVMFSRAIHTTCDVDVRPDFSMVIGCLRTRLNRLCKIEESSQ